MSRRGAVQVASEPNFRRYLIGNTVSNVGTWFQNLAAALLVFRLTGSTLLVGVVNFSMFLGAIVLAPWTGAAADRYDRRRLLLVTQSVAAAITAALAVVVLAGRATTAVVIAASALLGLALAFTIPALLALVPLLVAREDLEAAVGLNSVTFNLARAIGPVLAAVAVEGVGVGWAFAVNSLTFVVFVIALVGLRVAPREVAVSRPRLRDSLSAVRASPLVAPLLVGVMAVSLTSDPVNTLTPEFAAVMTGTDSNAGWLVGAFGAGATLVSLGLSGWLQTRQRVLAPALAVEAAGILLFAVAPVFALGLAGMALAGAGFITALSRATARIQLSVEDAVLGRVMAVWSIAFIGTRPLAALLDGAVAEALGLRWAAALLALPALLAALWLGRQLSGGGGSVAT